ncbi:MAG: hydrogenase maturation nickel metallochaperone HypA [Candidatus Acidiferrales bacterium]|jgi:hydrogenase nickel incorporation protein HypA/HybF
MHELSIALSIIEGVSEEVERLGGEQVTSVHLKLGSLSGVVKDALLFSYQLACAGTPLEGSELIVQETPAIVHCPQCNANHVLATIQHFRCPQCGAPTPEVLSGREVEVVGMEMIS